jgi:mRNA-degrading endonuclease toxin of MazEF toxin-antitoxin module
MADQLTTVSKLRMTERLGQLSNDDMRAVGVVRIQLGLRGGGYSAPVQGD